MKVKTDPRQEELPLNSVMAHKLFPGQTFLRVQQVAWGLRCTQIHVLKLIDEGRLAAVNIASSTEIQPGSAKTFRRSIRIPVAAWDKFINQSAT